MKLHKLNNKKHLLQSNRERLKYLTPHLNPILLEMSADCLSMTTIYIS